MHLPPTARHLTIVAATVVALVVPAATDGAPITFAFQGTTTVFGGSGLFGLDVGDVVSFTGSFTVDDTDLDTDPNLGRYECGGCASPAFTVSSASLNGGSPLVWSDARVLVMPGSNLLQVDATGTPPAGLGSAFFTFSLGYPAGTLLGDSLPSSLMASLLLGNQVRSTLSDGTLTVGLLGQLTDPNTAAPVPEPASLLLLGTGMVVVAARARRRQEQAQQPRKQRSKAVGGGHAGRCCART
jgi:hypothetical protein